MWVGWYYWGWGKGKEDGQIEEGEHIYKNGGEKDFLTFAAIKSAELPVEPWTYSWVMCKMCLLD